MVHQHSFRLHCVTTSMVHIPGGGLVFWPPRFPNLNLLNFFLCHLKTLVYEMLISTVEDLMTRIIVASADIASPPDLFERFRQSTIHQSRLCYDRRSHNFEEFLRQSLVFMTSS
ncbi:hypothetical protein TNCV_1879401 [Trichonephila clavipes]|nr:hypothetical protein TNCV_1879401 [Trichonephila clavipes]